MLEQIPVRLFVRWGLFAVALLTAATILATTNQFGIVPIVGAFALLVVFRPEPSARVTDAELEAWLALG